MGKKLIRKMQTAIERELRLLKFTPEQIALFENRATKIPGMNNSEGLKLRLEGTLAQQYLELEEKRKEQEILSRMERRPVLKRKASISEKMGGGKDEYEQITQGIGMSGADPLLSFYVEGVGLNGIGVLAKTGLWNIAKYAPTTLLGNYGRLYFVGNTFKNSFNGNVPKLIINPLTRTKVGDVEIDNPLLAYRLLAKGSGQNFIKTGYAYTPLETLNMINYQKGLFKPTMLLKAGIEPGWTTMRPMYSLGKLWFGLPEREGDLIVTTQPLRYGNSKGGITYSAEKAGTRRVSDYKGEVTPENSSVYSYEPGYGYKKIVQEPSTAYFGNPTLNFLKFIGNPKLGRETAANSTFYGSEKNLVEELKNSGVNLFKIPREAITLALNKRRKLINLTAPSSYTLVEGNPMLHFNYLLYDYRNGKPVGWMSVDRNKKDLNTYVQAVENTDPSYKRTYEKLLNSSIITSQSLGGLGSVSGLLLISAPKQYHVLQKFRNRELTPYKGTHTNAKMVYDKLGLETEDIPANGILDLSKAGDKLTKTLLNAPVWLLKSPTSLVPTKSTVFNPYIIDSNGKMHINWDDILIQHKYGGKIK